MSPLSLSQWLNQQHHNYTMAQQSNTQAQYMLSYQKDGRGNQYQGQGAPEDWEVDWEVVDGDANGDGEDEEEETNGRQIADLFFYDVVIGTAVPKDSKISLDTFETFEEEAESVYTWDARSSPGAGQAGVVWHTIKFKNNCGKPLTTGVIAIFSGEEDAKEILGQSTLYFTGCDATATLKVGSAMDIFVSSREELIEQTQTRVTRGGDTYMNTNAIQKRTLRIENRKGCTVNMHIRTQIEGEWTNRAAEDGAGAPAQPQPTETKVAAQHYRGGLNITTKLLWKIEVEAGHSLDLVVDYVVVQRSDKVVAADQQGAPQHAGGGAFDTTAFGPFGTNLNPVVPPRAFLQVRALFFFF